MGKFLCHLIQEHGSWGETTDSFLHVSQKSIWRHCNEWKKLAKEKKQGGDDEEVVWRGVITNKQFCYSLAPVALPNEV